MRNLLGRLHARPPVELAGIAAFWQVPSAGGDRGAPVGSLYRALTDPRAVRAAWDRLAADERDLVRLLAVGAATEATPTLSELAARLNVPEGDARQTAGRLYRIGLLAREGDDEPLPIGGTPRLFLPRELALLFRRVQDEIEAGDLSATPLRALLSLLDDAEIEEAATIWGLRVVPGLRRREELTDRLLRQVGDPERVAAVIAGRRRDALAIWRRVRDEPAAGPVPLADAAAAAGLGGNDPRAGQRLRTALADLETALLVWHTYRADAGRWLFVPSEIRAPRPPAAPDLPPLAPVTAGAIEPPPWRHPDALAWDVLTLLREVVDAAPPWPADADPPRAWLRRLNARLWHRGTELPPTGYVAFLAALARAEGLLQGGDPDQPVPSITAAARVWRDRSFADQSERLRRRWLDGTDWIEGRSRGEVEVWGADWRGARRRLLPLLAHPAIGLTPGVWHALDSVATRIAAHDPDLLGATFTAATARHAGGSGIGGDAAGRLAAVAEVVAVELTTAFAWFGLVELAAIPGHAWALRVVGRRDDAVASLSSGPTAEVVGDGALVVTPTGEIELSEPTPVLVWSVSAFAEPERLERVARYRLSAGSLARALAAGFDVAQVAAFLTRQGRTLPPAVAVRLEEWARGYGRVRLRRAVVLSPDDPAALSQLRLLVVEAGLVARPLDGDALLLELPAGDGNDGDDPELAVLALLRDRGYAPQWARAAPLPRPTGGTDRATADAAAADPSP